MFLIYKKWLSESIMILQRRGIVSRIFQTFDSQRPIFQVAFLRASLLGPVYSSSSSFFFFVFKCLLAIWLLLEAKYSLTSIYSLTVLEAVFLFLPRHFLTRTCKFVRIINPRRTAKIIQETTWSTVSEGLDLCSSIYIVR